jgi:outer membrane protein
MTSPQVFSPCPISILRSSPSLMHFAGRLFALYVGLGAACAGGYCQEVSASKDLPAPVVVKASSSGTPKVQVQTQEQPRSEARLELTLRQAIEMALENNLDIRIQRVDQSVAEFGIKRTQGGGTPSQINYNIAETPAGVGSSAMPLLTTISGVLSPARVDPSGIVVSPTYDSGHVLGGQHSLSIAQAPYSLGSAIPSFDPEFQGQFAWIRRDPAGSIVSATSATPGDMVITNNTLGNATLVKGFSSGTSVQVGVNDFVQSFYSGRSSAVPFTHPNAIVLVAQPLLRGAGRSNNTRFITIAKTNSKISATVLEQQMVSTISGVENLYYDLVSLQEVIQVQRRALKAAEELLSNDQQQLGVGRMPPIEVARAEALVSAIRLALTEAEARREQQGNVLRSVLDPQSLSTADGKLPDLVAIDAWSPPSDEPEKPIADLIQTALLRRPDVRASKLQIANGERAVLGSSNARLPELDLYASFQSRGVIAPSLIPIGGDSTTGAATIDPVPTGGKSASKVLEVGIQFNVSVRDRVANADFGADQAELREERFREMQMESQAAAEVRNALIGFAAAKQAAQTASTIRKLQEQFLDAELEKFRAGMSTNFAVIQQQAYLAQAETTEVAAQAAFNKAAVQLYRALGETLEHYGIEVQSDTPRRNLPPQR